MNFDAKQWNHDKIQYFYICTVEICRVNLSMSFKLSQLIAIPYFETSSQFIQKQVK